MFYNIAAGVSAKMNIRHWFSGEKAQYLFLASFLRQLYYLQAKP